MLTPRKGLRKGGMAVSRALRDPYRAEGWDGNSPEDSSENTPEITHA